ncbi:hypothetical protein [Actinoplanes sp. NPDC051851]|uniref:hypothetical protein n=1 Tax=Actinoplanes sp. NPDC051851 TaxID=3154753 RepID=UPI003438DE40
MDTAAASRSLADNEPSTLVVDRVRAILLRVEILADGGPSALGAVRLAESLAFLVEILADDGPPALVLAGGEHGGRLDVEILADGSPSALGVSASVSLSYRAMLRSSPTADRRRWT